MEPVGVTLGVLGLAGLFTVCIDCFDYVQRGSSVGKDFLRLEGQFRFLQLRFSAWGKAAGFMRPDSYDQRLNNPIWRRLVQQQLNSIPLLFLDGNKLVKRYELQERHEFYAQSPEGA